MPLTDQNIPSLSKSVSESLKPPDVSSYVGGISNTVQGLSDPIGPVIKSSLSSITKLTGSLTAKIEKLQTDIINSADNTGKVKLVGNRIVITLEPQEAAKAASYKAKIEGSINSVRTNIERLNSLIKTLDVITKTAQTLKTALEVQEVLLKANPVSAATFSVLKKGINIIFMKDILNQYVSMLGVELAKNSQVLNQLVSKFSSLTVDVVVKGASNNGQNLSDSQAQSAITDAQLSGSSGTQSPQDYSNDNGQSYTLTVEKYSEKEIIGRARDKFSGLMITETAPSFHRTPEQLIEELKTILNT